MIAPEDIVVCLPAYNEATVLADVIAGIREEGYMNICVVDDGSTDDTAGVARRAGAVLARHTVNLGAGAAVQTAIELARRRGWGYIVFMDADGQHLASDIELLSLKMAVIPADLVIGSRFLTPLPGIPRSRKFYNAIGNRMTNLFCREKYSDTQSGLRLLNRKAIMTIQLKINGFGFCSEMIHQAEKARLVITETPISVRYTDYSQSKGQDLPMGFATALHFLWNLVFR